MKKVLTVLIPMLLLALASPARAEIISVDVGSYAGQWAADGPYLTGDAVIDLAPGIHPIFVGPAVFQIDVAAGGAVTVLNGVSATGGAGTLIFETVTLTVDPGLFEGDWGVPRFDRFAPGPDTFQIVPGLRYHVNPGGISPGIRFDVDAAGNVNPLNPASASGGAGLLTFNTVPMAVDPGAFGGNWGILNVRDYAPGSDLIDVVPGVHYFVRPGGGRFTIKVEDDGDITSFEPLSATGGAGTLTFQTVSVSVDPGAFAGQWSIANDIQANTTGPASVILVPGNRYTFVAGRFGTGAGSFAVDILPPGDVVVENGVSGTGGSLSLSLANTTVFVDPGSLSGTWEISNVLTASGAASVVLVPGVSYQLIANGRNALFALAEPCAVSPATIDLNGAVFNVGCGLVDSDGDGVPNGTDNCPDDANPDQVDLDLDGSGDACDGDDDGDGVLDDSDNCPLLANPTQADLDGDGIGDLCDEDADGDSVPDGSDNCLGLSNVDQSNADGDGFGDACDPDDDNDGVADDNDNCPFTSNPEQADFDGDGEGDPCDGDRDGDGVANDLDECADSPSDRLVDAGGCTGPQRIALACVRDHFVQHGQYVSCVAHAANDAVGEGLITNNEKSRFVRAAAKAR